MTHGTHRSWLSRRCVRCRRRRLPATSRFICPACMAVLDAELLARQPVLGALVARLQTEAKQDKR